jgi:hypothetical protein
MRTALEAGKNPAVERRAERTSHANTFEAVAREWLAKQPFAQKTMQKAVWTFEDLLFPYIGSRPVSHLSFEVDAFQFPSQLPPHAWLDRQAPSGQDGATLNHRRVARDA